MKMGYLILVRHGESRWNGINKFTGWVDVPLSEVGIHEAMICAKELEGLRLDVAFTSKLERAHETLMLILAKQDYTGVFLHETGLRKKWSRHHGKLWEDNEIPIYSSDALNERYYGELQGMNKDKARKYFGEEKVRMWRRSYDIKPPGGESLKGTVKRTVPYFKKHIMPHVKVGMNVIISAHGNSLRAIIKHIDQISDEEIPHLELPTGKPIIYKYAYGHLIKENHIHNFKRPMHWTHKYINHKKK